MKGTWQGYYKHNNLKVQKIRKFAQTNFTIVIQSFDGKNFGGNVTDDLATGGMQGIGYIIGTLNNTAIAFEKLMPIATILTQDGSTQQQDKPHSPLYYKGTLSADGTTAAGTWKFKNKIVMLFGIIPIPYCPGRGVWQMELINGS
ncbi:hypothetical protein [Flavobacterium subsaxonicum]|uniref:Uncharacterized protein n=1 Tax=Flavobacterium subsaxonicum WB 4.1-42 = DSM 21790 TaxID=1121898 RepID=A0A0A2MMI6_9FLAO|nr:hypothetical protein [Flavobacterium subsaxonicum]KGO93534.1 hypothetical protein Q766_06060 [Flavobacterium subsaxonicum WB 4.1-42 = DSM 21790]